MNSEARAQLKSEASSWCAAHLNFYRVHLLYFTITPLLASVVFYYSNGSYKYTYVDSLFICVTAICVCGLCPVPLSPATPWQQALIVLLICGGSLSSVSLITIVIRLKFFRNKFKEVIQTSPATRKRLLDIEAFEQRHPRSFFHFLGPARKANQTDQQVQADGDKDESDGCRGLPGTPPPTQHGTMGRGSGRHRLDRLRPNMIQKVDNHINIQEAIERLAAEKQRQETDDADRELDPNGMSNSSATVAESSNNASTLKGHDKKPYASSVQSNEQVFLDSPLESPTLQHGNLPDGRDATSEYSDFKRGGPMGPRRLTGTQTVDYRAEAGPSLRKRRRSTIYSAAAGEALSRTRTMNNMSTKHTGYGGFTNPVTHLAKLVGDNVEGIVRTHTVQPGTTGTSVQPSVTGRGLNVHQTGTLLSQTGQEVKPAPYITFDAMVGRNSRFQNLTDGQQEELGGVEYRALKLLWKIVFCYWLGFQTVAFVMLAPYMNTSIFADRFADSPVHPVWYTMFQVWSAYSNTGLSLDDSSMVPFNATYFLVLVLCVLILAGNTAFPIFLRLTIWIFSKVVPKGSQIQETLQFLLDHPRRSFLYLFPSYQTWFLVFVLIVLNCCDWFFFVILDIGNAMLEAIPLHIRVLDGLFQALAVRAAGFNIINVGNTAPALQVLYIIMMYIAVYPIALSIRSTNVYEERSMGLYEDDDEDEVEEQHDRSRVAGSYIAYHARKQLAFDSWWLVFALWLICIMERSRIEDAATSDWFNTFTVLFEVTSAYGTVGLSLGSEETGTSLVGSFGTLSKLVLMAVIIRGRHRGLPNAIDRAVLLPSDMHLVEGHGLVADEAPGRLASVHAGNLSASSTSFRGRAVSSLHQGKPSASSPGTANPNADPGAESIGLQNMDDSRSHTSDRHYGLHVGFETPKPTRSPSG